MCFVAEMSEGRVFSSVWILTKSSLLWFLEWYQLQQLNKSVRGSPHRSDRKLKRY